MRIVNFEATGLKEVERWMERKGQISHSALQRVLRSCNVSFLLEGINRLQSTLICELKDSYVQQSQRYVVQDEEDNYLLPNLNKEDTEKAKELLQKSFALYKEMSALKEGDFKGRPKVENYRYGIPIEDARYILPLAVKTNVCVAMSADKLLRLFWLFTSPMYGDLFKGLKEELLKCLPEMLRYYFEVLQVTSDLAAEDFYDVYFKKIDEENNMVLLESFSDLDLKAGLGALTSTLSNSPADKLAEWQDDAEKEARAVALRVMGYGHTSIAEQARTTFGMMCSMVTYHQQLRHRLTNNFRENLEDIIINERAYKVPPTIETSEFYERFKALVEEYKSFRKYIASEYSQAEAMNFILNCDQIKLVISSNARMDMQMLADRICFNAQWEIRELSTKKLLILKELSDVLYEKALPPCVYGKCKEGNMTCGKAQLMKEKFMKKVE